eukprot:m.109036 g.109036  ORF g.109036 m.109036 type:complete len:1106 (-) comp14298_c0_seq2:19-3336(-)
MAQAAPGHEELDFVEQLQRENEELRASLALITTRFGAMQHMIRLQEEACGREGTGVSEALLTKWREQVFALLVQQAARDAAEEETRAQHEAELAAVRTAHMALQGDLAALEETYSAIIEEHTGLRERHEALESDYDVLREEHTQLRTAHATLQSEHTSARSRVGETQAAMKEAVSRCAQLEKEVETLQRELDAEHATRARLERQTQEAQAATQRIVASVQGFASAFQRRVQHVDGLANRMAALEQRLVFAAHRARLVFDFWTFAGIAAAAPAAAAAPCEMCNVHVAEVARLASEREALLAAKRRHDESAAADHAAALRDTAAQIAALREEHAKGEAENARLTTTISELRGELAARQAESDGHARETETRMAALEERVQRAEHDRDDLIGERDKAVRDAEAARQAAVQAVSRHEEMSQHITSLQDRITQSEMEHRAETDQLEEELQAARETAQAAEVRAQRAEEQCLAASREISSEAARRAALVVEITEAQAALQRFEQELAIVCKERDQLRSALQAYSAMPRGGSDPHRDFVSVSYDQQQHLETFRSNDLDDEERESSTRSWTPVPRAATNDVSHSQAFSSVDHVSASGYDHVALSARNLADVHARLTSHPLSSWGQGTAAAATRAPDPRESSWTQYPGQVHSASSSATGSLHQFPPRDSLNTHDKQTGHSFTPAPAATNATTTSAQRGVTRRYAGRAKSNESQSHLDPDGSTGSRTPTREDFEEHRSNTGSRQSREGYGGSSVAGSDRGGEQMSVRSGQSAGARDDERLMGSGVVRDGSVGGWNGLGSDRQQAEHIHHTQHSQHTLHSRPTARPGLGASLGERSLLSAGDEVRSQQSHTDLQSTSSIGSSASQPYRRNHNQALAESASQAGVGSTRRPAPRALSAELATATTTTTTAPAPASHPLSTSINDSKSIFPARTHSEASSLHYSHGNGFDRSDMHDRSHFSTRSEGGRGEGEHSRSQYSQAHSTHSGPLQPHHLSGSMQMMSMSYTPTHTQSHSHRQSRTHDHGSSLEAVLSSSHPLGGPHDLHSHPHLDLSSSSPWQRPHDQVSRRAASDSGAMTHRPFAFADDTGNIPNLASTDSADLAALLQGMRQMTSAILGAP